MNRVLEDYQHWNDKERKLADAIPTGERSKDFLMLKLNYLAMLGARYKGTAELEERMTLGMVRSEAQKIAKTLYPQPIPRLIRGFFRSFVIKRLVKKEEIAQLRNQQEVQHDLTRIGLAAHAKEVIGALNRAAEKAIVPISYVNAANQHMELHIPYEKNEHGQYERTGMQAVMTLPDGQRSRRTHFFSNEPNLNITKVESLLAGRAIRDQDGSWRQLDFTDKDAEGNYRTRRFASDYGGELMVMLRQLPVKVNLDEAIGKLSQGSIFQFMVEGKGAPQTFALSADPMRRGVHIRDGNGKETSMAALHGQTTVADLQSELQEKQGMRVVSKRGVSMHA
jgi:hypothetical protein